MTEWATVAHENAFLRAEIDRLRCVLIELSKWQQKPWTDMADPVEQQLDDSRHALKMACAYAAKAVGGK